MQVSPTFNQLKAIPWEAVVWVCGLAGLACYTPGVDHHVALCPFKLLGIEWCPGCGLGTSIAWLFRGEWRQSLSTHPLGIAAVFILSFRIVTLTKLYFRHGKSH